MKSWVNINKLDGASPRGLWWRLRRKINKKGARLRRRLCRKVVFASLRGLIGRSAARVQRVQKVHRVQRVWWRLRRSFIGRLSAGSFDVCVIFDTYYFGDWPLPSVSRPKGRPFYGQAKGQLRLTWRSYAGPPQPPLSGFAGLLHGKASHLVLRSPCSPTNRVRLPPLFRGQDKVSLCFPAETCALHCPAPIVS